MGINIKELALHKKLIKKTAPQVHRNSTRMWRKTEIVLL